MSYGYTAQPSVTEILDEIEDLDRDDLLYLLNELRDITAKNNIALRYTDKEL